MLDNNIKREILTQKYMEYVSNHIKNVKECFIIFTSHFADQDFIDDMRLNSILRNNIISHDASKFGEEEFEPYRKNFHPISEEEKEANKEAFDKAWKHHYTVNPHHWNHWYNEETGECEKMPSVYLAEMIVDWMAMGVTFGNSAYEYYQNNKDNIKLHPDTRVRLEYLLKRLERR